MNTRNVSIASDELLGEPARPGTLDRFARRRVIDRMQTLRHGQVIVIEDGRRHVFGKTNADFPLTTRVDVHDPGFWGSIAFGGSIGAAESYIHGQWSSDELCDLLRILIRNRDVLDGLDSGLSRLGAPIRRFLHRLNRNTRAGSRRNIAAHYDLGNDFYSLWLDPQMMYSAAWFESPGTPLETAAVAKLERICRKLDLKPDDAVIEIGTGWGGFAIHAAKHYGCRVTTTTISKRQFDYATAAVKNAGLEDRITILNRDYRDLEGRYDKLVSIEMIEAVGHEYHDIFFKKCCELLKPHGQMLLQAITIADQRYDEYKSGVDFIKRYIFPGGCLTSVTDMCRTMTEHTDMRVIHVEDIGPHYALTLRHWRERFFARIDEVRQLGYSNAFVRMWDFYLSYCESAFIERAIGDVQMLIMRPDARRDRISY